MKQYWIITANDDYLIAPRELVGIVKANTRTEAYEKFCEHYGHDKNYQGHIVAEAFVTDGLSYDSFVTEQIEQAHRIIEIQSNIIN